MSIVSLKNDLKKQLKDITKGYLIITYILVSQKKYHNESKENLINQILSKINYSLVRHHKKYIETLSPSKSDALYYYQGPGYINLNLLMRYGLFELPEFLVNDRMKPFFTIPITPSVNPEKIANQFQQEYKKFLKDMKGDLKQLEKKVEILTKVIKNAPRDIKRSFCVYRGENNDERPFDLEELPSSERKRVEYQLNQINHKKGDKIKWKSFNSFSIAPWVTVPFNFNSPCCLYRLTIPNNKSVPFLILPPSQLKEYEVLLPPAEFVIENVWNIHSPLNQKIKIKVYDLQYSKGIA